MKSSLTEYIDAFKNLEKDDKKDIILKEIKQTSDFIKNINDHYNIESINYDSNIKNLDDEEYLNTIFSYIETTKENLSKYVNYNLDKE